MFEESTRVLFQEDVFAVDVTGLKKVCVSFGRFGERSVVRVLLEGFEYPQKFCEFLSSSLMKGVLYRRWVSSA